jgi:c-di-GMP-binding flagellar brake protein YcgR
VSNRRKQYRVTARFDQLVKIEVVGPKVHCKNVVLQDLSAGGAGIILPKSASGMLRLRDRIELRLESTKLSDGPVTMFARICHLDERTARPNVGLAFESWREHRALLDSDLRELFNEREAFRVEPGSTPVIVETATLDRRVRMMARLRDISVQGFGLDLPFEAAERFQAGTTVSLRFAFPGSSRVIHAPSQIRFLRVDALRHRTISGLRMADGPRVDPKDRREIARYVMSRQRELLRMGLGTDDFAMATVRPELRI